MAELGENVTFHCPDSGKDDRFFSWYKQSLGYMIQTVATGFYNEIKLTGPFTNSRFKVHKVNDEYILTIDNVHKEDEATYFCQSGTEFSETYNAGFFLAVNGKIT